MLLEANGKLRCCPTGNKIITCHALWKVGEYVNPWYASNPSDIPQLKPDRWNAELAQLPQKPERAMKPHV